MRHIGNIVKLGMVWTGLLCSSSAFAEDCTRLDSKWNAQISTFEQLLNQGQYDKAGELFKTMSKQCSKSPELNYYEGKRREALHDTENAKIYYQRASEYTYQIAVEPGVAKKIWYARYEAESPERSKGQYAVLEEAGNASERALLASEMRNQALWKEEIETRKNGYAIGLWTGVGLGMAGVILMSTGGGIAASMKAEETYHELQSSQHNTDEDLPIKYRIDRRFRAGLAVAGIGVASTIIGAILSGIYGYKWVHADDDEVVSIQAALNSVMFSLTF